MDQEKGIRTFIGSVISNWGWLYVFTFLLVGLVCLDRIPQLRGVGFLPGNWQWDYLPGKYSLGFFLFLVLGAYITWLACKIDIIETAKIKKKYIWAFVFSILSLHLLFTSLRGDLHSPTPSETSLGIRVSQRSLNPQFDLAFEKARFIYSPLEAFGSDGNGKYSYLKPVEPHSPPGYTFLYRVFLSYGDQGSMIFKWLLPIGEWLFEEDGNAMRMFDTERFALFIVALFKFLSPLLIVMGVWLLAECLPTLKGSHGKLTLLLMTTPALLIYTFVRETAFISFGFLALATGVYALKNPQKKAFGLFSGVLLFSSMMMNYLGTLLLIFYPVFLYVLYNPEKDKAGLKNCLAGLATPLILLFILRITLDYQYIPQLIEAIGNGFSEIKENRPTLLGYLGWRAIAFTLLLGFGWLQVMTFDRQNEGLSISKGAQVLLACLAFICLCIPLNPATGSLSLLIAYPIFALLTVLCFPQLLKPKNFIPLVCLHMLQTYYLAYNIAFIPVGV